MTNSPAPNGHSPHNGYRTPLLNERAASHGDYGRNAGLAQSIKHAMRASQNWPHLSPEKRESLDLIATKIARILEGDPSHKDHWDDIAGYAKLIAERSSPAA